MKQLFLILLSSASIHAAAPAWTASVDSRISTHWPAITNRQAAYKANLERPDGRYWQGLPSHSVIPQEAALTAPDRDTEVAPGHTKSLRQMLPGLPATFSAQYEMHEYRGPFGDGFILIVRGRDGDGIIWERTLQHGPETGREHNWRKAIVN